MDLTDDDLKEIYTELEKDDIFYEKFKKTSYDNFFEGCRVGEYFLEARKVKKFPSSGIKTIVKLSHNGKVLKSDSINISKDTECLKFFSNIKDELEKTALLKSLNYLQTIIIDELNINKEELKEYASIIETENGYVKSTAKENVVKISSAIINLVCRIDTHEGEIFQGELLGKKILFGRRAWDNRSNFLKTFKSGDFHFFGGDNDIQAILGILASKNVPKKRGITIIGRHENAFVFPDRVIANEETDYIYTDEDNDLCKDFNFKKTENPQQLLSAIYANLLQINEPNVILPIIGVKFVQPFCPEIRKRYSGFPVLYVYGTPKAGKSTTLRLFRRLFGLKPGSRSVNITTFALAKITASTNCVGITLDEMKFSGMREQTKNDFIAFIRQIYDGSFINRGVPTLNAIRFTLSAPLEIYGEQVTQEQSIVERIIPVRLNVNVAETRERELYIKTLEGLELEGLAEIYYKWVLGQDFEKYAEAAEKIVTKVLPAKTTARIQNNLTVMTIGLSLFANFFKSYGLETKFDLVSCLKTVLFTLSNTDSGRNKTALDYLLEQLSIMADKGLLKEGVDYCIKRNGSILALYRSSCVSTFRKFANETKFPGEVLTDYEYFQQAREEEERKGYVLDTKKNERFEDRVKKALIIDTLKLSETLDVTFKDTEISKNIEAEGSF